MTAKAGEEGLIEVFCAYVIRNGKIIFPKRAKCFHFWMRAHKAKKPDRKSD